MKRGKTGPHIVSETSQEPKLLEVSYYSIGLIPIHLNPRQVRSAHQTAVALVSSPYLNPRQVRSAHQTAVASGDLLASFQALV